jgi:hypothetical protein
MIKHHTITCGLLSNKSVIYEEKERGQIFGRISLISAGRFSLVNPGLAHLLSSKSLQIVSRDEGNNWKEIISLD